jgi:hypothetical protein
MNIPMRVHRVSTHPVDVEVVFNGEKAHASLPELEVELTSDDGHGSQMLHFRSSSDVAAAKALFKQGGPVMMTFAAAGPAKIDTTAAEADPAPEPAA